MVKTMMMIDWAGMYENQLLLPFVNWKQECQSTRYNYNNVVLFFSMIWLFVNNY